MGRGGAASFVGADIAEGSGETDGWWTKWVSKYLKGVPAPMREDRPMIKSNYLHLMAWGLPFPVYGKYSASASLIYLARYLKFMPLPDLTTGSRSSPPPNPQHSPLNSVRIPSLVKHCLPCLGARAGINCTGLRRTLCADTSRKYDGHHSRINFGQNALCVEPPSLLLSTQTCSVRNSANGRDENHRRDHTYKPWAFLPSSRICVAVPK
jgi:hypothetical protein